MTLKTWLFQKGIRQREFARLFKISQPFLSQILSGKRRPSWEMATYIEKATDGDVKRKELMA